MQENTVKKPVIKELTQVQLSNWIVNNLSQFNLKPTAKLVLLYLASCYNPKHADVFPKQKTIADRMGVSEASVIRAISELHKEGLIISERKYTNRYKFTSRILNLGGIVEDLKQDNKMQDEKTQNASLKTCNLQVFFIISSHCISPFHHSLPSAFLHMGSDIVPCNRISFNKTGAPLTQASSKQSESPGYIPHHRWAFPE